MKTFLVLSETTLIPLLVFGLMRYEVHIVGVLPHTRFLRGPLRAVAALAFRLGLVRDVKAISADLSWIEGLPGDGRFNDIFQTVADRLAEIYPQPDAASAVAEYGYAMRKCLTDYTTDVISVLVLIKWVEENRQPDTWKLVGAPPLMGRVYQLYFDREPPFKGNGGRLLRPLYNILNGLGILVAALGWLALRTRPTPALLQKYHLAVDIISLRFERELLKNLTDDPSEALLVYRTEATRQNFKRNFQEYSGCVLGDARTDVARFAKLSAALVGDMWRLWKTTSSVEPGLFGRYCTLVGKRAMFAAFFQRHQPRFFFGRDDYSIDHIIRNQELRKVGGTSIGMMHGIPTNTYISEWNEVDFDIYLVMGWHLYEKFYRDMWPSHMKVVATGCFRMTPEYFARRHQTRPDDIAYFPIVHRNSDFLMAETFRVAEHFSDRTVYVKMKAGRGDVEQQRFERQVEQAPANVVIYEDVVAYDLLLKISYALGAGTTVSAEAVCFGVKSFVFDADPKFKKYYFRNFPEIIVETADDVIQKIEDIEAGRATYNFDGLDEMIAMPDQDFFSVMRHTIETYTDDSQTGAFASP
ncbi:MAG: hypothetical protein HOL66_01545 [Rhodospirillaceae bacterium]|nr:hypothetical protein [Rhodospirillaceae bacterium]MBT5242909.1 hypothetical protein [Rhodospirillaceae bacterium]MBT5563133.1 hypothetical protein [Rhodospirillaceae bacterium]MBT6243448.1 hypothetical protein [Rhodospirillaceae bacterium]MBT7138294.1 hypothetical protein [Rhodospirillaceae bacterium]